MTNLSEIANKDLSELRSPTDKIRKLLKSINTDEEIDEIHELLNEIDRKKAKRNMENLGYLGYGTTTDLDFSVSVTTTEPAWNIVDD